MRIKILGMSTWGALGNWLSAKALASVISNERPNWDVTLIRTDDHIESLSKIGGEITQATLTSTSGQERRELYSGIMASWDDWYSSGNEVVQRDVSDVNRLLAPGDADLVICSKGLLGRLASAARSRHDASFKIVNYVTNHGHFQFPLHACDAIDGYLVRLEAAKAFICEKCSVSNERVLNIGYLLPLSQRFNELSTDGRNATNARCIVLSNRGSSHYLKLLHCLSKKSWIGSIAAIFLGSSSLLENAKAYASACPKTEVYDKVSQVEYLKLLGNKSGVPLFISKCSPNAVFEALACGMIPIVIRSGLPMEDWAADLVQSEELGIVCESEEKLVEFFESSEPLRFETYLDRGKQFVSVMLNQEQIPKNVIEALHSIHNSGVRP
ncbi:hypothetical protein SH528x_003831 [Novipirellula sp. SH528]|uniref:hypothetical protein n=1 Tax=Novipirellula sp. SH528 TaxID=3454466 RepID=UPI003F9EBC91